MALTCQSPCPGAFLCVPTVENQIGIMTGPVCSSTLQKVSQLGLYGLQGNTAGGVVTAERLDHVVGEEALHTVKHTCRTLVQLLHLIRW